MGWYVALSHAQASQSLPSLWSMPALCRTALEQRVQVQTVEPQKRNIFNVKFGLFFIMCIHMALHFGESRSGISKSIHRKKRKLL